jgi:hypothetical protein
MALALAGCGSTEQAPPPDMTFVQHDFAEPLDSTVLPDLSLPLPDLAMACDPVQQNCAQPTPRCTVIQSMGQTQVACVAPTGMQAIGAVCTRDADLGVGFDDCAAGFCSSLGDPMATRRCRSFCKSDADCVGGGACVGPFSQQLREGFCAPRCAPFGGSCQSGQDCSLIFADMDGATSYALCHNPGPQAAGQSCGNAPCAAGLACLDPLKTGTPTCLALCDGAHPCTVGTCTAIPGLGGAGYCK